MHEPGAVSAPRSSTWLDLVLYLTCGFGLILLSNIALSMAFQKVSIGFSLAIYLVNTLILAGTYYLLGLRRGKVTWSATGLTLAAWDWNYLWIAVAIVAVTLPVRYVLAAVAHVLFGLGLEDLQARLAILTAGGSFSWLGFALTLLGVGLLAPIAEELYFRGLIHRWFVPRTGFWPRVLLSSAIFGLAHFDSAAVVLTSFVLGLANAVAYEKGKSLWIPILVHAMTNSIAVVLLYGLLALGLAPEP